MIAYQAYGAMLGVRLSAGSLQTGDVDIAQLKNVSVAVEDSTPPVLDVLKEVDKSVRAVPHVSDGPLCRQRRFARRLSYNPRGQGDQPAQKATRPEYGRTAAALPGFPDPRSRATVILHGPGIYVHVPAPARYAVHRLIVSHRRPDGVCKA